MMSLFDIQLVGLDKLYIDLDHLGAARVRIAATMTRATALVEQVARERMAALFRNPGRMQAALSHTVEGDGDTVFGTVTASGLPYLRIHEYGGVIQTPAIFPKAAQALAFNVPGQPLAIGKSAVQGMVFAKSTRPHPTPIPERSYLRYALATRRTEIREMFRAALTAP
jgi:hypothetical protein